MFRRAGLGAVILLLLAAATVSAATKAVSIYSNHYAPTPVKVAMGDSVQWTNTTGSSHTVVADTSFLTSYFFPNMTVNAHGSSSPLAFPEAGAFTYHDSNSALLHGTIKVPMKADATNVSVGVSVSLTLGTVPASNGGPLWHIVQSRLNGGAWSQFSTTSGNTTGFSPNQAGTWQLRTCLHHGLSGVNTGWSPILTVTAS